MDVGPAASPNQKIPPPCADGWVAVLLMTWELVMTMFTWAATNIPPPMPKLPAPVRFVELFWMMLLEMVTNPVPLFVLKTARPPPSPSVVVLLVTVQLVNVIVAAAGERPVSNSIPPPKPSWLPLKVPLLRPNLMTTFERLPVALVNVIESALTANTKSTPLAAVVPAWMMDVG